MILASHFSGIIVAIGGLGMLIGGWACAPPPDLPSPPLSLSTPLPPNPCDVIVCGVAPPPVASPNDLRPPGFADPSSVLCTAADYSWRIRGCEGGV